MDPQRPLVPEGGASASSHDDMDSKLTVSFIPPLHYRKRKPGPKRDSKPAPSEKLARNRQAQRRVSKTHRERKEQYLKDMELEILRLKELFANASRERDAAVKVRDEAQRERDELRQKNRSLQEENQRMRGIIQASSSSSGTDSGYDATSMSCEATRNSSFSAPGDAFPGLVAPVSLPESTALNGAATDVRQESAWEMSESRGFASDDPLLDNSVIEVETAEQLTNGKDSTSLTTTTIDTGLAANTIDYDELGLDFVLSLERPCMGHIQYLHVRAHNYQSSADGEMAGQPLEVPDDGENQHISGHSLMATAPPYSHILETPNARYPTQYPTDLKREDLLKLLDLSSQLVVNERELPPVKAWLKIVRDGRLGLLSVDDFDLLKRTLLTKVNCYRFGAVIEDSDIEDALQWVMEAKSLDTTESLPSSACHVPAQVEGHTHQQHAHGPDPHTASHQYSPPLQSRQMQVLPGTAM